uniref:TspO protein n=1 Tax=Oscillatoriales cyanobacterium SpSt-402 TaxID=2282168 RepID=A0A832H3B3_9CYAN
MESYFLLAIGCWNLIGSIVLYFMLNPAIADKILRQWIELITVPYEVGKYGSLWLVWAASTNMFFSVINVLAIHWARASQVVVICGDLFVYGILLLSMIVVLNDKGYGRGLYISIFLSIFWMLWAVYSLFLLLS